RRDLGADLVVGFHVARGGSIAALGFQFGDGPAVSGFGRTAGHGHGVTDRLRLFFDRVAQRAHLGFEAHQLLAHAAILVAQDRQFRFALVDEFLRWGPSARIAAVFLARLPTHRT